MNIFKWVRCFFDGHVRTEESRVDIGKWKCTRCGKVVTL